MESQDGEGQLDGQGDSGLRLTPPNTESPLWASKSIGEVVQGTVREGLSTGDDEGRTEPSGRHFGEFLRVALSSPSGRVSALPL